jgi:hypothetical protein
MGKLKIMNKFLKYVFKDALGVSLCPFGIYLLFKESMSDNVLVS